MTQYQDNVLSQNVYGVDNQKPTGRHYSKGSTFKIGGQEFSVIEASDKNDGFQAFAVAPKKGKNIDYSNITVAYAGTGDAKNTIGGKDYGDIIADAAGVVLGGRTAQFKDGINFFDYVKSKHPSSNYNITGHSLGGAIGYVVAAHEHVPATVFSAPIPYKAMNFDEQLWLKENPEMVINFRHKGDILSAPGEGSLGTTYYAIGQSGFKGHDLSEYYFDENGNVGLYSISDQLKLELFNFNNLYQNLKQSGGGLSKSEKILLDAVAAIVIADSLVYESELGLMQIVSDYRNAKEEAKTLWNDTIGTANNIGINLTHSEIKEALNAGGANEKNISLNPRHYYKEKIKVAADLIDDFKDIKSNMKNSVNSQVKTDNDIARQWIN